MEKIINVKVSGSEIEQSSNYGGVQGEGGARILKISFDDEWTELSKSVTFFDVNMKNPVKVMLTTLNKNTDGSYNVPIPKEPLKEGERFTYIIDGSTDGALQRSVKKELKVKYAPVSDSAAVPEDITPSLADQLNLSIQHESKRTDALEEKMTAAEEDILKNTDDIKSLEERTLVSEKDIENLENTVSENKEESDAWKEALLNFYLPFLFEGYAASEEQAKEGINNEYFLTPKTGKAQFDHYLSKELVNTPEIYAKETVEGMYALSGMKHGDMCIILNNETKAQSIYRYYTKDINGNPLSSPQWVWLTDLSLFAPNEVLDLEWEEWMDHSWAEMSYLHEDLKWDYLKGNTARVDGIRWGDYTNLYITNVKSGDFGIIDVYNDSYGSFSDLILANSNFNSYEFPPDWDYLEPSDGQHYRYSFYYDGNKFDWSRSVRNDN